MVSEKAAGFWYSISPESLWDLIRYGLENGFLRTVWKDDIFVRVESRLEEHRELDMIDKEIQMKKLRRF